MADLVEAELGVRRLIAEYCLRYDDGQPGPWGELFTDDAVLRAFGDAFEGRDAILGAIGPKPDKDPCMHATTNTVVDLDAGARSGRARTDFLFLRPGDGGPVVQTAGRYYDRVVREGDRWRFTERAITFLGEGPPAGW